MAPPLLFKVFSPVKLPVPYWIEKEVPFFWKVDEWESLYRLRKLRNNGMGTAGAEWGDTVGQYDLSWTLVNRPSSISLPRLDFLSLGGAFF